MGIYIFVSGSAAKQTPSETSICVCVPDTDEFLVGGTAVKKLTNKINAYLNVTRQLGTLIK